MLRFVDDPHSSAPDDSNELVMAHFGRKRSCQGLLTILLHGQTLRNPPAQPNEALFVGIRVIFLHRRAQRLIYRRQFIELQIKFTSTLLAILQMG